MYGDALALANAQNLALRHLCAALRCVLGEPEASPDAATGHTHIENALMHIEAAEQAVRHTNDDPTSTSTGKD